MSPSMVEEARAPGLTMLGPPEEERPHSGTPRKAPHMSPPEDATWPAPESGEGDSSVVAVGFEEELIERLASGGRCSEHEAATLLFGVASALLQYWSVRSARPPLEPGDEERRDSTLVVPDGVEADVIKPAGNEPGFLLVPGDVGPDVSILDDKGSSLVRCVHLLVSKVGPTFFIPFELVDSSSFPTKTSNPKISSPAPEAADVWALGSLLYFVLSGDTIWDPDTFSDPHECLLVREEGMVDLFSDPWPSISAQAKHLLARMLRVDAKDRATAQEILEHPWVTLRDSRPAKRPGTPTTRPSRTLPGRNLGLQRGTPGTPSSHSTDAAGDGSEEGSLKERPLRSLSGGSVDFEEEGHARFRQLGRDKGNLLGHAQNSSVGGAGDGLEEDGGLPVVHQGNSEADDEGEEAEVLKLEVKRTPLGMERRLASPSFSEEVSLSPVAAEGKAFSEARPQSAAKKSSCLKGARGTTAKEEQSQAQALRAKRQKERVSVRFASLPGGQSGGSTELMGDAMDGIESGVSPREGGTGKSFKDSKAKYPKEKVKFKEGGEGDSKGTEGKSGAAKSEEKRHGVLPIVGARVGGGKGKRERKGSKGGKDEEKEGEGGGEDSDQHAHSEAPSGASGTEPRVKVSWAAKMLPKEFKKGGTATDSPKGDNNGQSQMKESPSKPRRLLGRVLSSEEWKSSEQKLLQSISPRTRTTSATRSSSLTPESLGATFVKARPAMFGSLRGLMRRGNPNEMKIDGEAQEDMSDDYAAALALASRKVERELLNSVKKQAPKMASVDPSLVVQDTAPPLPAAEPVNATGVEAADPPSEEHAVEVDELVHLVEVGDRQVDNLLENFSAILVKEQEESKEVVTESGTPLLEEPLPLMDEESLLGAEPPERQSMVVDGMGRRLLQGPMAHPHPKRRHGRSSHVFC